MRLEEIKRTIHKTYIPDEYKNMKIIGRGTTSIVLEKDNDTVIILTRDRIKVDWLRDYLDAELLDVIDMKHRNYKISSIPVYVLKVKKLYPLSRENRKKVLEEIKKFDEIIHKMYSDNKTIHYHNVINYYLEKYPDGILSHFFEYISNYDPDDFSFDLHRGNFLQDKSGNIIVADPVISQDLLSYIHS